jgi:hypothetical protein
MFVFVSFFSDNPELQTQGIYWFGLAAIFGLLPTVLPFTTKLKVLDFELEFREKLEEVEKRVEEAEDVFLKAFESLQQDEKELPPDFVELRNRHWDKWDEDFQSLSGPERFKAQRANSLIYLDKFGLTVRGLKEQLAQLGFYKGEINNSFSRDLATAIEDFQRSNNMRHVDGMFGELTFAEMVERLKDQDTRKRN